MNLYIWEGNGVLTDYSDGMIIALANTQEQAESIVDVYDRKNYPAEPTEIIDLTKAFVPKAWICWGGA
jgi:hypothetical protein